MSSLGIDRTFAAVFGMMAVSTFLLTTLDTCTRLCRFVFEKYSTSAASGAHGRDLFTLACRPSCCSGPCPPRRQLIPAWQAIWPAFGATNQLLAALALLVAYAWLKKSGKKTLFVLIPLIFMSVTTLTALTQLVVQNLFQGAACWWASSAWC
jgi:carbon starvation protein